jgi:hypothetical protein
MEGFTMDETTGLVIFWLIVAARLLVPLSIPKYPLPGILASLIIDAADQTIFQQFPSLSLEGYQGYDKALDTYYLTVAYISTFRNWANQFAFQVSRFLFYWRLVGVVLFEFTHLRPLLLIFPNTFEYFFIFYETYRLWWDPTRMSKQFIIGAAALIWIVVKLPQEYWIHIAQFDTTDLIKESLFGVPVDTAWNEIFAANPGICIGSILIPILVLVGLIWVLVRHLPPADRKPSLSADAYQPAFTTDQVRRAIVAERRKFFDTALLEKIILIGLLCLIFTQVLPGVVATPLQVMIGIILVVTVNTGLSHWLARRGFGWIFSLWQSLVLLIVNSILFFTYAFLMSIMVKPILIGNAVFFVLLLTLLITLYDRYRQVYMMRFSDYD